MEQIKLDAAERKESIVNGWRTLLEDHCWLVAVVNANRLVTKDYLNEVAKRHNKLADEVGNVKSSNADAGLAMLALIEDLESRIQHPLANEFKTLKSNIANSQYAVMGLIDNLESKFANLRKPSVNKWANLFYFMLAATLFLFCMNYKWC